MDKKSGSTNLPDKPKNKDTSPSGPSFADE
jgi:hypothetical protein